VTVRGVTLLEVVISLVLLTVGAFALAAGIATGERARRAAVERGFALAVAEAWLETWRAGGWPEDGQGSGGMSWSLWRTDVRWRTSQPGACLAEARVEAGSGRGAVVLVTRRYRQGAPGCGA
jgi:Tfp pilus assembly protein PilV